MTLPVQKNPSLLKHEQVKYLLYLFLLDSETKDVDTDKDFNETNEGKKYLNTY